MHLEDEDGYREDITLPWLLESETDSEDEEGYPRHMNFEDFLVKLAGIEPSEPYNSERYDSDPGFAQVWDEHWRRRRTIEQEIGVSLVRHASSSNKMYILAAAESVITADWGEPKDLGVTISSLPKWRTDLEAFCARIGIPFVEPQFILCSYSDYS